MKTKSKNAEKDTSSTDQITTGADIVTDGTNHNEVLEKVEDAANDLHGNILNGATTGNVEQMQNKGEQKRPLEGLEYTTDKHITNDIKAVIKIVAFSRGNSVWGNANFCFGDDQLSIYDIMVRHHDIIHNAQTTVSGFLNQFRATFPGMEGVFEVTIPINFN